MDRIRKLGRYQKVVLAFITVIVAVFFVAYHVVSSHVGFEYKDSILVPQAQGENMVYTGKVNGENTTITVTADKTVTVAYEQSVYGPYTVKEDATAIPVDKRNNRTKGVEILQGEEIYFRGAYYRTGTEPDMIVMDEKGELQGFEIYYTGSDGVTYDGDGNPIDERKPGLSTIIRLTDNPEMTSKGDWQLWFYATIVSVMNAVSILFADEIFRWNMSFRVRNADKAQPSDWEIFSRHIGWTVLAFLSFGAYIAGLTIVT